MRKIPQSPLLVKQKDSFCLQLLGFVFSVAKHRCILSLETFKSQKHIIQENKAASHLSQGKFSWQRWFRNKKKEEAGVFISSNLTVINSEIVCEKFIV